MNNTPFNAGEFCSRKLFDLLADQQRETEQALADATREAALGELARRGHYLTELANHGLISATQATR